MRRHFVVVLILMLVSFTFIMSTRFDDWDDQELRWKFIYKAVCLKRPLYGKCRGHREMWYFDRFKMKCSQFTYSNCGGNTNRFFSKSECDEFCTAKLQDLPKAKIKF